MNTYEVNRKEHSVVLEYYNQVLEVLDQYVNDYPECNNYGAFGDSIRVMSSQSRSLFRVVAVIQPAEPPPTIQIFI